MSQHGEGGLPPHKRDNRGSIDPMSDLSPGELQAVFDLLEIKRGEKLGCWVCGGNEWRARKVLNVEQQPNGLPDIKTYVQLICPNCRQVAWFTDKLLDGIG